MRVRIAAVLACLAVSAAGKPKSHGVSWATGWNAAVQEARALNLPLIVHRHGFY